ncbi:glycoside hydrolase family 17 protein [Viridothelium virens]|uniref:glucan endo-1,3-beta-D-glucosidase n=1 Tax=Viridothelium virens TaxID=1048519 RepID=A0A6A6GW37_VIRVR|nr:glycoside hydrolase family 17 protein [Viridothelium virens]
MSSKHFRQYLPNNPEQTGFNHSTPVQPYHDPAAASRGSRSYQVAPVNTYSGGSRRQDLQQPYDYAPPSPPPPLPIPTDSSGSPTPPPPPPPHRSLPSAEYRRQRAYSNPNRQSVTTPAHDNLSEAAAGGGITGIAVGVANTHERESGVQALQDIDNLFRNGRPQQNMPDPPERQFNPDGAGYPIPPPPEFTPRNYVAHNHQDSYVPNTALAPAAYEPGISTPQRYSDHSIPLDGSSPQRYADDYAPYSDSPYNRHSARDPFASSAALGSIDPYSIADDGDDGLDAPAHDGRRRSFLNLGRPASRNQGPDGIAPAGAIGAAAGGAAAGKMFGSRNPSGSYNAVPDNSNVPGGEAEKSAWLDKQTTGNKRLKWIVGGVIGLIIVLAIVGGVVGGVLTNRKNSSSSSSGGGSSSASTQSISDSKGDLNANSPQIQALMNNPNLKKVFPGMDYTPLNAQYPDCLNNPPIQNNVTADIAVLSQLTNVVRLYGTDCNQTEMVLHAFSQLNLQPSDMKLWLGVYLNSNQTTNNRQISQMWSVLQSIPKGGASPLAGVIVGNEVLFSKYLSEEQLITTLTSVKQNLTSMGLGSLPLATSDLGDNWNSQLAQAVDVIMANVHPFFAGVTPDQAPGWTWDFWQQHDVSLDRSKPSVIAEVGWPSEGGNDCGTDDGCPNPTAGAVASVPNMNTFMEGFVCQSLKNGTNYFWFEAFDEPWKVMFNTPTDNWESKWGLMDVNRNLKPNITIPDCGGQRIG